MILLDTHVVVWLYDGLLTRLPAGVRQRLDAEELALSPIVQLEIQYLHEVGRLRTSSYAVADELRERIGLTISDISAAVLVTAALTMSWTRDPFDRLLAAHATTADVPLVTRDDSIRRNLPLAWWPE